MITGTEQSVLQDPAYRLTTNGASKGAPFLLPPCLRDGDDLETILLVVLRTAAFHHPRRLHQPRGGHPAA
jgi:hypothetical protein